MKTVKLIQIAPQEIRFGFLSSWLSNPLADSLPRVIRTVVSALKIVAEFTCLTLEVGTLTLVTSGTETLGKSLQCLHVNTFDFLASGSGAHDHRTLVVDGKTSDAAALRTSRVSESFVESPQLFDDSVTQCSSRLY